MVWNRAKDASTTQSKLGFKICGMQVFRCMPAAVRDAGAQHGNVHKLTGSTFMCRYHRLTSILLKRRHLQRGFWRASKRWCKGMSEDAVNKALLRFANNGVHGIS
jgi:Inositol polyphosphate kinase